MAFDEAALAEIKDLHQANELTLAEIGARYGTRRDDDLAARAHARLAVALRAAGAVAAHVPIGDGVGRERGWCAGSTTRWA